MMRNDKNAIIRIKCKAEFADFFITVSIFIIAILLSFTFSPIISKSVLAGLSLCYTAIIPSVFPFMILSDLLLSTTHFENFKLLRKLFSRIFKINGCAISAFLAGTVCGFPIGPKLARELYLSGKISKNECERLIGFSNNASPAFVISGVGFALLDSTSLGIILYLVSVFSSVIIGFLSGIFQKTEEENLISKNASFSLTASVKSAAENTVTVCGFITVFSVIIGFLSYFIKNRTILAILSSFLEIGNAAKIIVSTDALPREVSISLLAFAISFSGLSVHFQSKNALSGCDVSMKKYYIMKLAAGALSAIITATFLLVLKR